MDDVLVFNRLGKEQIFKIIDIELKALIGCVDSLGCVVELSEHAKQYIAVKGFDSKFLADPLKGPFKNTLKTIAEEI